MGCRLCNHTVNGHEHGKGAFLTVRDTVQTWNSSWLLNSDLPFVWNVLRILYQNWKWSFAFITPPHEVPGTISPLPEGSPFPCFKKKHLHSDGGQKVAKVSQRGWVVPWRYSKPSWTWSWAQPYQIQLWARRWTRWSPTGTFLPQLPWDSVISPLAYLHW